MKKALMVYAIGVAVVFVFLKVKFPDGGADRDRLTIAAFWPFTVVETLVKR